MEQAMDDNSASPISLLGILILLIILNLVIILQDFHSSFNCKSHTLLDFLFLIKKVWADTKINLVPNILCFNKINADAYKLSREVEVTSAEFLTQKLCFGENANDDKLSKGEVEMVMEKLGICCDPDGDTFPERLGSDDIAVLFEGQGPSLEEVKEAFDMFDENSDGFIDARELKKILSTLGFMMVSEVECQKMIRAFDEDENGVVDFNEFVKLLE